MYMSCAHDSQTDAPNGICMLAKTLCELTDDNQELIEITKKSS